MNQQPAPPRFSSVDAQALPWTPSACASGVQIKNLGKANGRAMQLVRFDAGTVFPMHLHTGPEFIYMLEGEAIQNGQRLLPGWVGIAEAGTVDDRFRSDTGCVFLLIYDLAQRFC
ncbi:cupin domain-containing protein [Paraburkholderia terrae]|jgi:anti-sigma factor ChrR (cupin superfamily)|uniref:cupin domain-containing protein n=1 Tax=Paraburkholderia TaxID=1822464 RepID=UPI001EE27EBF|nr:cupin domain-containing protein [Paraburkholderia terrae]BEU25843.1 cupin domain-containing protein [Paraburkholderia sp. 22B1P]GJH06696.1 cupin domain-containing protein [Paraburkholderia terrae]